MVAKAERLAAVAVSGLVCFFGTASAFMITRSEHEHLAPRTWSSMSLSVTAGVATAHR